MLPYLDAEMTQEAYRHLWWRLIDFCRPVSFFLLPNHLGLDSQDCFHLEMVHGAVDDSLHTNKRTRYDTL